MLDKAGVLVRAREALREVVPRLADLVRDVPDGAAAALGTWTVGDVAAHLAHTFRVDADALAGRPAPSVVVTAPGMASFNACGLAEESSRDPAALARRIGALAREFDDTASRPHADAVEWLQGIRLPASAVACHLLEECLIHGHDIARAAGRPWPIERRHAILAIEGGVFPLISALPPGAFLDTERAASFRGRFDLRLRGGGRALLDFDSGSFTVRPAGADDIDAHLWADPAALMLTFIGRQGVVKPVLEGKLAAWGQRPWKLARMLAVIRPP